MGVAAAGSARWLPLAVRAEGCLLCQGGSRECHGAAGSVPSRHACLLPGSMGGRQGCSGPRTRRLDLQAHSAGAGGRDGRAASAAKVAAAPADAGSAVQCQGGGAGVAVAVVRLQLGDVRVLALGVLIRALCGIVGREQERLGVGERVATVGAAMQRHVRQLVIQRGGWAQPGMPAATCMQPSALGRLSSLLSRLCSNTRHEWAARPAPHLGAHAVRLWAGRRMVSVAARLERAAVVAKLQRVLAQVHAAVAASALVAMAGGLHKGWQGRGQNGRWARGAAARGTRGTRWYHGYWWAGGGGPVPVAPPKALHANAGHSSWLQDRRPPGSRGSTS